MPALRAVPLNTSASAWVVPPSAFLSYAAGTADSNGTVVASAQLTNKTLSDVEVVFSATPDKYAPLHYGGRLAWLADGTLLLTTGDGFDFREQAQNLATHFGKMIRMNPDGSAPADNPFPEYPFVFSYGHRNPQGLAVAKDGTIYQHEHGPRGGDAQLSGDEMAACKKVVNELKRNNNAELFLAPVQILLFSSSCPFRLVQRPRLALRLPLGLELLLQFAIKRRARDVPVVPNPERVAQFPVVASLRLGILVRVRADLLWSGHPRE